ncbi:AGAP008403-PA-like protein [Anopheles sinensis]|uniref:AGAP008403-PA-like protein n=1 Tax=Anopheles sinensis TaxID=74873 RepID=A0A084WH50_ANOSI|nr:AGAP008403-PA-like protein [Anopheles sinensis]
MAANRVKLLRAVLICQLITIAQFIGSDCHLRYYKYGEGPEPLPAFGQPAYLREFAHMAAVGWTKPDGSIGWNCGGSLIWENYVLTAAHCAADDENNQPDVVRLGDIDLYNDTDDQYAQQLKIVEIIRHPEHRFSSRYHDLALLRLEKNVVLHDTVAPGCLWNDEEIPFPSMEATGWGATGFGQNSTPILLKVSLSVVKKAECDRQYRVGDRGLKQGLQNYHLCAGDIKMDTCPGDSGGPLQIKLLHNAKMTPFVVAVTSFGSVCGKSVPGVYMKVSSYIPWIRSELAKRGEKIEEWSFKPYACALRYVNLREYEDDVVISKSASFETLDSSKAHMNIIKSTQTVKIHWPPVGQKAPDDCYGVVIDEDTVLTLARCAVFERSRASYIVHNDTRNEVVNVYRHPMYTPGSYYNDLAVLKTKNRFKLSRKFVPACIWSAFDLPDPKFYVTGQGRLDINEFNYFSKKMTEFKPQIVQLSPRADIQSAGNCSIPEDYLPGLTRGLTEEHLCFGNKPFLVPEACQMQFGAPLRRKIWRTRRHFEHIYGLNLFGKDCGFGRSAVATRLGFHHDWLKSVLLPNYRDNSDAVNFFNKDLDELDHCAGVDGSAGLCVEVSRCPKVAYDIGVNRNVRFCGSNSVVCCPYHNIKNQTTEASAELDDCESRYKSFHREYTYDTGRIDQFFHTVYIGHQTGGQTSWPCTGTLIARNIVVSSAYCLTRGSAPPNVVNIAAGAPNVTRSRPQVVKIDAVAIHRGYDPKTYRNDIALVRLEKPIVPTAEKYPICLWQNDTHTPFRLQRMVRDDGEVRFVENYPKYNTDCQEFMNERGGRKLSGTEFCTDIDVPDVASISGDPIVWSRLNKADNTTTQYLVGIISFGNAKEQLGVNTRISAYVGWIKSLM